MVQVIQTDSDMNGPDVTNDIEMQDDARPLLAPGQKPWIGIDLGTTNSCVGLVTQDGCMILGDLSQEGTKVTPSVVCFEPNGKISVGKRAQEKKDMEKRKIFEVKRFIGRSPRDPCFVKDR